MGGDTGQYETSVVSGPVLRAFIPSAAHVGIVCSSKINNPNLIEIWRIFVDRRRRRTLLVDSLRGIGRVGHEWCSSLSLLLAKPAFLRGIERNRGLPVE